MSCRVNLQDLPSHVLETVLTTNTIMRSSPPERPVGGGSTLTFPHSRTSLWDPSPTGDSLSVHLSYYRNPRVIVSEKTLRLAHRHAKKSNESRFSCFLLGTVSVDLDEEGVALTLDRFDPGRYPSGVKGPAEEPGRERVPTALAPGDVCVPCVFVTDAHTEPHTDSIIQSEAQFHDAFKALHHSLSSRETGAADLSQVMRLRSEVSCRQAGDRLSFCLHWTCVLPGTTLDLLPVGPLPLIPTALVRNLTSLSRLATPGHTTARSQGFLTMDQHRKLLLMLEMDPKACSLPLVGVWLSGVTHVWSPRVWLFCLRFLFSAALQDRVLSQDRCFLVVLFSQLQRRAQFYQCQPSSSSSSSSASAGTQQKMEYQLLSSTHTFSLYQHVEVSDGSSVQCELTSDLHNQQTALFEHTVTSAPSPLGLPISSVPPPGLSISDQDSGMEDGDLSPRPSPKPHPSTQQTPRVQPLVPELSLLLDGSFVGPSHNPAEWCEAAPPSLRQSPTPAFGQTTAAAKYGPPSASSSPGSRLLPKQPTLNNPLPSSALHLKHRPSLHPHPTQAATHHPHASQTPNHHSHLTQTPNHHPHPSQTPTHHPNPTQTPTHHPNPAQAPTHHPHPTQTPTHHPHPAQTPTYHPHPTQTPTHHPHPAQTPNHHSHPTQTPTHHPNPTQTPTHHPNPAQAPTHHPHPTQTPTHHPNPTQTPNHHSHPTQTPNHHSYLTQTSTHHPLPAQTPAQRSPPSCPDCRSLGGAAPPCRSNPTLTKHLHSSSTPASSLAQAKHLHSTPAFSSNQKLSCECCAAQIGCDFTPIVHHCSSPPPPVLLHPPPPGHTHHPSGDAHLTPDPYRLLVEQDRQLKILQAQIQMLLEAQSKPANRMSSSAQQTANDNSQPSDQPIRSTVSIAVGTGASLFWGDPVHIPSANEQRAEAGPSGGSSSIGSKASSSSPASSNNSHPVSSNGCSGGGAEESDSRAHQPGFCSPSPHPRCESPVLGESASMYQRPSPPPPDSTQQFYHHLLNQVNSLLHCSERQEEEEDEEGESIERRWSREEEELHGGGGDTAGGVNSATVRQLEQLGVPPALITQDTSSIPLASISPLALSSRLSPPVSPLGGDVEPSVFASSPLWGASADMTLEWNAIAMRRIPDAQLNRLLPSLRGRSHSSPGPALFSTPSSSTRDVMMSSSSDMSLATRKYMRRYGVLEEAEEEEEVPVKRSERPPRRPIRDETPKRQFLPADTRGLRSPHADGSMGNFLDISRLRQLPKLF